MSVMAGCSPEAGKKTLNFFFDGVPEKQFVAQTAVIDSSNLSDSSASEIKIPPKPENVYHPPYLEKECTACHNLNSMGKFVMPQPQLCYQCHEDFKEIYKVVHGPVAGGYCTACHNPHFTKEKSLLKRTGQKLCLYCHEPGEGFNVESHDGIEDTACTECHNPHGGETRKMFN